MQHQEEFGLALEFGLFVQDYVGGDVGGVDETLSGRGDWRGKTNFSSEKRTNMIRDRPYHAEQIYENFSIRTFLCFAAADNTVPSPGLA